MSDHVAAVCRAGYYRLRQLRPTVKSLPVDASKSLIQAFISNRLDYCNAALCGITDTLLRKLQSVQNEAARLLYSLTFGSFVWPKAISNGDVLRQSMVAALCVEMGVGGQSGICCLIAYVPHGSGQQ